ncbi:unnamed protein product [Alopecurus aequalis]
MDCSSSKETPPHKAWWTGETVAVVTGANRGIGHALAARLAEQGLSVVLTARDEARGEAAAAELRARGFPTVRFHRLDVTDPASVASFASWIRDDVGGLDILVNNAAVSFNEIDTNSVEHAETVLKTNFYGAKMLIEALLPLFRRSSGTSRILNLSSQLGLLNSVISQFAGPIQVESDCAVLVEELNLKWGSKSAISTTVKEIKSFSRALPDVIFSKVHRSGNTLAHELAKLGRSASSDTVMLGSVPSSLIDRAKQDCNHDNFSSLFF